MIALLPSQINSEEKIQVFVADHVFSGWEQASIDRSIENASGGFSLQVSGWGSSTISPESECRIVIGGDVALTGYVEGIDDNRSSKAHTVALRGRSRTCQAVDCSARPQSFVNTTLDAIATALCAPFGVDVVADVVFAPMPSFRVQPGESVYEAIERAARKQYTLVTDNAAGDLVLTRAAAGEEPTGKARPIVLGQNVLSRTCALDWSGRFKTYKVHGQGATAGDVHHRQTGEATDDAVTRVRELLLVGGSQQPGVTAANRAEWEKRARLGKSITYSCQLQGWRDPSGALWRANAMAQVWDDDFHWFGVPLLVTSVAFEKTKEGATLTNLVLRPRQGYETPEASVARHGRGVVRKQKWRPPLLNPKDAKAPLVPWLNDEQTEGLD